MKLLVNASFKIPDIRLQFNVTSSEQTRLQSVSDGGRMQACRPSLRSFRGFGVDTRAMLWTNIFGSTEQCFDFRACTALPTRGGTPGPPIFGITSRNKNTPDLDHTCNNNQGKTKYLGKPTPLPLDMLFRIRNQSFLFLLVITEARPNILLQMQLFITDTTTRNVIRIIESFSTN